MLHRFSGRGQARIYLVEGLALPETIFDGTICLVYALVVGEEDLLCDIRPVAGWRVINLLSGPVMANCTAFILAGTGRQ